MPVQIPKQIEEETETAETPFESMQDDIEEMGVFFNTIVNVTKSESTVEESIEQLIDDPEDVRLLVRVMTQIIDEEEIKPLQKMKRAQNLKKVDKVLYKLLKANRIPVDYYGTVHLYLNKVGGTQ